MQMIGQIAVEGIERSCGQHQLLFVDSVAQVASKNAEVWQGFRGGQALLNEITRPAACLDDLLPPMPDNRSTFAENIPFGFHSGRNIRMHKFGLLSTGKAQVDTGLVGVGDIMPDARMLNSQEVGVPAPSLVDGQSALPFSGKFYHLIGFSSC